MDKMVTKRWLKQKRKSDLSPFVSSLLWAQRSKKLNPDRNLQSRSKFLIPLKNFNLEVTISPQKNRAAVGGSLENFILARNFQSRSKSRIFLIFGPSGSLLWHSVSLRFVHLSLEFHYSAIGDTISRDAP